MKMVATIGKWRGIRRDGARDRNRTYKDRSPVDFESTASASSATRARRKAYHKSVLIEGSATSFSWARRISVNDHRSNFLTKGVTQREFWVAAAPLLAGFA